MQKHTPTVKKSSRKALWLGTCTGVLVALMLPLSNVPKSQRHVSLPLLVEDTRSLEEKSTPVVASKNSGVLKVALDFK